MAIREHHELGKLITIVLVTLGLFSGQSYVCIVFILTVLVQIWNYKTTKKNLYFLSSIKNCGSGLPWWRSGWESACQCRGRGFEPWSGRIPYAAEQLSP